MSAASRRLGPQAADHPAAVAPARACGRAAGVRRLEAVDGAASGIGGAQWPRPDRGPARRRPRPPRRPARQPPPARWCAARSPACRRAAPGPASGPSPARRAAPGSPRGRASRSDALQHGVGALRALDGQHLALRHHHGLAGVDDARAPAARQSRAPRRPQSSSPERHAAHAARVRPAGRGPPRARRAPEALAPRRSARRA